MADELAIQELVEKMSIERDSLLAGVQALDEPALTAVPVGKTGEEEWTVKQQLAHLWQMERMYDAWIAACLREHEPDLNRVAFDPVPVPIAEANGHPVGELLEGMNAERLRTLAIIEHLAPADFDRGGSHALFGRLSVMQWLRSFYRHDRMHRDQIAGKEPEYKPRFVSGVEPDQRGR